MSVLEDAAVNVLIADYIGVDAAGKINALGLGFAIAGLTGSGMSAAQHVAVIVDLPSKYRGTDLSLGISLYNDDSNTPVKIPGPNGPPDDLRILQVVRPEAYQVPPGVYLPSDMPVRVQAAIGFPGGLPLTPGHYYSWRAEIDGQTTHRWRAQFYLPGPIPAPVFGGSSSPVDIPTFPKMD